MILERGGSLTDAQAFAKVRAMRISLGTSDFRELRQEGFDYIDKSLLICDLIDESSKVVLLPRPRRFGKTLNLSMLRYYFERPEEGSTEDRWALFQDLAIAQAGEHHRAQFQRFPTIHVTFKDIKADSWETCATLTANLLGDLYGEHTALLPHLQPYEAERFDAVLRRRASLPDLSGALFDLSRYLSRHHGQSALILLDEYDTPLHTAHLQGYYDKALTFFRNLLSMALKDNVYLHKGVLTGVLRVAKDNIFTGLNNITVFSMLTRRYATAFGFTQTEVEALLHKASLTDRLNEVQQWYNGYLFGGQVIYNPWSVLCYVAYQPDQPEPYWANTSGNELVRDLLVEHGAGSRNVWETLLRGETIERPVVENVALRDLKAEPGLLWSVLVFTGYLKVLSRRQLADGTILGTLAIPNKEVATIYSGQFLNWLNQGLGGDEKRRDFLAALLGGDTEGIQRYLSQWLLRHASYHDTAQGDQPERFYHGLVLGLLVSLGEDYEVRSNPESGFGRCDLLIKPRRPGRPGVVMELKVASVHKKETLLGALKAAQRQIQERGYAEALREAGAEPVHELAVAWLGKDVLVAQGKEHRPAARKPVAKKPAGTKKRR